MLENNFIAPLVELQTFFQSLPKHMNCVFSYDRLGFYHSGSGAYDKPCQAGPSKFRSRSCRLEYSVCSSTWMQGQGSALRSCTSIYGNGSIFSAQPQWIAEISSNFFLEQLFKSNQALFHISTFHSYRTRTSCSLNIPIRLRTLEMDCCDTGNDLDYSFEFFARLR